MALGAWRLAHVAAASRSSHVHLRRPALVLRAVERMRLVVRWVRMREDGGGAKFSRGEEVLAVYPDTTSFYPAQVAQAKKGVVGVHVQFDGDDIDGFGLVPVRIIPVKYVIRMQIASVQ